MHLARQKRRPSLNARRAERELFFGTARQLLGLVLLAALVLYSIVSLLEGHLPCIELLLRNL
jgi:hypothetical protein